MAEHSRLRKYLEQDFYHLTNLLPRLSKFGQAP